MFTVRPLVHMPTSSLPEVKPATDAKSAGTTKPPEKPVTLEFKFTPSVDKLTELDSELTGTYNSKGKLAVISNKTIVYVEPSAYIRDQLVRNNKVV
jgi:hypothetical protein